MTSWSDVDVEVKPIKIEKKKEEIDWLELVEEAKEKCKVKTTALPWYLTPIKIKRQRVRNYTVASDEEIRKT